MLHKNDLDFIFYCNNLFQEKNNEQKKAENVNQQPLNGKIRIIGNAFHGICFSYNVGNGGGGGRRRTEGNKADEGRVPWFCWFMSFMGSVCVLLWLVLPFGLEFYKSVHIHLIVNFIFRTGKNKIFRFFQIDIFLMNDGYTLFETI